MNNLKSEISVTWSVRMQPKGAVIETTTLAMNIIRERRLERCVRIGM
jgi:hypothetical protein